MKTKNVVLLGARTDEELEKLVDDFVGWFLDGGGEQEFMMCMSQPGWLKTSVVDGVVFATLEEGE